MWGLTFRFRVRPQERRVMIPAGIPFAYLTGVKVWMFKLALFCFSKNSLESFFALALQRSTCGVDLVLNA